MIQDYRIVRRSAKHIGDIVNNSAKRIVRGLEDASIEQEPDLTSRLLESIEGKINELNFKEVLKPKLNSKTQWLEGVNVSSTAGIHWTSKVLTDRGRGAQENIFGADLLGVLKISVKNFIVKKGFLAQAKLIKPGRSPNFKDLKKQCEKMLKISPASFVF